MKTKDMKRLYVVLVTFEYDSTIYGSELIDVYDAQTKAFKAMENFDIIKFMKEIAGHEVVAEKHIWRSFELDEQNRLTYSETTYVSQKIYGVDDPREEAYAIYGRDFGYIASENYHGGSVTITITEVMH